MKKNIIITILSILSFVFFNNYCSAGTVVPDIKLPPATEAGGATLMVALKNRHTSNIFSRKPLDLQLLSDLLWAANGENRADGKRTTPSSTNIHLITLYVAFPEGVYRYDPSSHNLDAFSKENILTIIGSKYPLAILYVANLTRQSKYLAGVDCGFIGQNVYLFSSANDLNTTFLYDVNATALSEKLGLKLGEEVLFAQIVGYKPDVK